MASVGFHSAFRKYHRIIGFFLAGIMALYALSGILLIFRTSDFLKYEQTTEKQLESGLNGQQLGPQLRMRGFKVEQEDSNQISFAQGVYNKQTGIAVITDKDYPPAIAQVVHLHKATTNSPLYVLNILFGVSLLFYVLSAFLMFVPKLPQYKTGLKIASAGFVFALLVVVFGS